jgi:hypothetical protein
MSGAFLWGLFAGSSLIVGGALALICRSASACSA